MFLVRTVVTCTVDSALLISCKSWENPGWLKSCILQPLQENASLCKQQAYAWYAGQQHKDSLTTTKLLNFFSRSFKYSMFLSVIHVQLSEFTLQYAYLYLFTALNWVGA